MVQVQPFQGATSLRTIALGEQINANRDNQAFRRDALTRRDQQFQQQQRRLSQNDQNALRQALPQVVGGLFEGLEKVPQGQRAQRFNTRLQAALPALQSGVQAGVYPPELIETLSNVQEDQLGGAEANFKGLIQGQNAQGEPAFLQTDQFGNVREAPGGFSPAPRQPTAQTPAQQQIDQQRLIKAEADAKTAQGKAVTEQRKQRLAEKTQEDIKTLAGLLLDENGRASNGVKAVFGATDSLTPTLLPESVDADARIEQLVNFLTLENLGRMSGVLSDSDIRILQNAGTILKNRRISDELAEQELQKIAGIIDKAPGNNIDTRRARLEELRRKRDEGTLDGAN